MTEPYWEDDYYLYIFEQDRTDMDQAAEAKPDNRQCTCHPDDRPIPCTRKFATGHCWRAAVYDETREAIVTLKNRDRSPMEQKFLDHLVRVERALEGTY